MREKISVSPKYTGSLLLNKSRESDTLPPSKRIYVDSTRLRKQICDMSFFILSDVDVNSYMLNGVCAQERRRWL